MCDIRGLPVLRLSKSYRHPVIRALILASAGVTDPVHKDWKKFQDLDFGGGWQIGDGEIVCICMKARVLGEGQPSGNHLKSKPAVVCHTPSKPDRRQRHRDIPCSKEWTH